MNNFKKGLAVTAFAMAASGCGDVTPALVCESADHDRATMQTVGGKYSRFVIQNSEGQSMYDNKAVHGDAARKLKEQIIDFCKTGQIPAP